MTGKGYREAAEQVLYLAACAVNGTVPDAGRVRDMDLGRVYQAAEFHLLTAACAMALESAGIREWAFVQAKSKAIRKVALMDAEKERLSRRLEEAGIWYMPLKGCVLKDLYPAIGMRQMADVDILIDPERSGDAKAIMEDLGFRTVSFGCGCHDIYCKEPVCSFELHRALFGAGQGEKLQGYYREIEARQVRGKTQERRLTSEDFYLYMIAHEYKHYCGAGTGLRALLDTYVVLGRGGLDWAYLRAEAEKLGIRDFEEKNRLLSQHLFGGEALTEAECEMLEYMLGSGTYGSMLNRVENTMKRKGWGRTRYALGRFRVPLTRRHPEYAGYAAMYPLFYRHRLLLPLLPFYRTLRAMKAGRLWTEAGALLRAARPG